ncbi:MAG: hypothetical protein M1469_06585 [Bacteroidetes bacterium]|nr:hypothetical protein [Bacteroidota bacterium]
MKALVFLLFSVSLSFARAPRSPLSAGDSLSRHQDHEVRMVPQVGLGLGVGKGSVLFIMAGWQLNENYAIEGRLDARSVIKNSDREWGDSGGWSILVRRQFPISYYIIVKPHLDFF